MRDVKYHENGLPKVLKIVDIGHKGLINTLCL